MSKRGFTLIELMVTVAIIAILTVVGLTLYSSFLKSSRDTKRQSDLKIIQSALEEYNTDQKYYPVSGSLTSGGQLTNTTGGLSTTISKTYLNIIPSDPKISSPYIYKSYLSSGGECTNANTGSCVRYCLYALVENSSNSKKLDGIPTDCPDQGLYNLEVTSP